MHYTVTLDMISTKIHLHVLLLIMCYKYTKITQVKNEARELALLSQSDQEGAKQHIHFCYNEA